MSSGAFGQTLHQSSLAMRAMAANGLTQGAAIASGLQRRFNWHSVAATGMASWAASQWRPYAEHLRAA